MAKAHELVAYVNGKRHVLPNGAGEWTLLQYLRHVGLSGTKLGCGEGGCGACTVMVSRRNVWTDRIEHRAVNACLCALYSVENCHVITVEGIGNLRKGLHPVQEKLAHAHGSQCGFCTPGFVMSMYALLRSKHETPTEEDIEEALAGNLCRCTGYRPILDAFRVFAKADTRAYTHELEGNGTHACGKDGKEKMKDGICPGTGLPCRGGCSQQKSCCEKGGHNGKERSVDLDCGDAELIFPPELVTRTPEELHVPGKRSTWHRPLSLESLLDVKHRFPDAKIIVGNTEVGIEMKFKHAGYPQLVDGSIVGELNEIHILQDSLVVGSSVTLSTIVDYLRYNSKCKGSSMAMAFLGQLKWFAGLQIRNAAAIGGNICTASPISDLNPLLVCCNASFEVQRRGSASRFISANSFFLGYRKTAMHPEEVLVRVHIPLSKPYEYVQEFKQAHRRDDDIAIVNAGMRVQFKPPEGSSLLWVVEDIAIAYGGVAPNTVAAEETAAHIVGKPWTLDTLRKALDIVSEEIKVGKDAPGGMVEFRNSLVTSFLFKFFAISGLKLAKDAGEQAVGEMPAGADSAAKPYERPPSKGLQYWGPPADGRQLCGERIPVGEPVMHMAAELQVTGEAQYSDDCWPAGTLVGALVASKYPHAEIVAVDPADAIAMEGVQGFFSAKDVPGSNAIGAVALDEECFATKIVTAVGQPIGIVVAETEQQARAAALKVHVEYKELPPIISIKDAIAAGSEYKGEGHSIIKGNADGVFESGEYLVMEGECRIGGQEHFYLEPQNTLVIPGEGSEISMFSSTQAPMKHQKLVASVLGVPANKVVCRTKRIGGGFGGKETRSFYVACAAAVPSYLLNRPVRLCLDRDEDMQTSGHRHAFLCYYKLAYTPHGKLVAIDAHLFNNAGNSLDLSTSIMDRALLHLDNVYNIPHMTCKGHVCKTNQMSNTAFRGFGGPQGMLVMEMILEKVAAQVGKTPVEIREMNFYKVGEKTHYGQALDNARHLDCWTQVIENSEYHRRRLAVDEFNKTSKLRKRGISAVPTKFGISFTTKFLNQAGALVHIYTDGTVLLTHGGVEMGQGLHTKVAQITAATLGIPLSSVYVAETATDKVPNASPTAASASSDMYGAAALDACQQLMVRLRPYMDEMPGKTFKEVVNAAYLDRVDLSAHGFYKTPDVEGFGSARPFNYFCFGASVSEVEIDCLTGDFQVLRTDIVMDAGNPLNPAIDVGQVEGAFVQGMGWCCIEELVWGDEEHKWVKPGQLHTRGPGTYKIPTANDIPIDFRVSLLAGRPNDRAVASSKAVGEPPFFLSTSVFFAIRDAIRAARSQESKSLDFELDSPATPERIRLLSADKLTGSQIADDIRPGGSW